MKITFWSDYACPFCYIGENHLKQAIKELGLEDKIELEMKSFQLDPHGPKNTDMTTIEKFVQKFGMSKEEAQSRIDMMTKMANKAGLEFHYDKSVMSRTTDAHRLTKYAANKEKDKVDALIDLLMEYYFVKNYNLADHDVLRKAAETVGLNMEEAEKVIKFDTLYLDEVESDHTQATMYGISSVPFFIVGKFGLAGAESVETMKKTISQAIEEGSLA